MEYFVKLATLDFLFWGGDVQILRHFNFFEKLANLSKKLPNSTNQFNKMQFELLKLIQNFINKTIFEMIQENKRTSWDRGQIRSGRRQLSKIPKTK